MNHQIKQLKLRGKTVKGNTESSWVNPVGSRLNTVYRCRGRLYFIQKCDECPNGILYVDKNHEIVCSECGLVHENYHISNWEFLNGSGGDEPAGDDDSWRVAYFESGGHQDEDAEEDFNTEEQGRDGRYSDQRNIWRYARNGWRIQGSKLRPNARGLSVRDIEIMKTERVLSEIEASPDQVKNSTILVKQFIAQWLEDFDESISRHGVHTKVEKIKKIVDSDLNKTTRQKIAISP